MRERAEDRGAMRNGFIARNSQSTADAAGGLNGEVHYHSFLPQEYSTAKPGRLTQIVRAQRMIQRRPIGLWRTMLLLIRMAVINQHRLVERDTDMIVVIIRRSMH